MLITHEIPSDYLTYNPDFCNYTYCLAPFIEAYMKGENPFRVNPSSYEKYYQYFSTHHPKATSSRLVYLDNGAFELGSSIDMGNYSRIIEIVNPTHYFIPDKTDDYSATIEMFDKWIATYYDSTSQIKPAQALQGDSIDDLIKHCRQIKDIVEFVGVSYDYKFFGTGKDRVHGRYEAVSALVKEFPDIKIHLLGCESPMEFAIYDYPANVISVDTSHPVALALEGKTYADDPWHKPTKRIAENLDAELNMNHVLTNTKVFRRLYNDLLFRRKVVEEYGQ